jgi:hypothetical protein
MVEQRLKEKLTQVKDTKTTRGPKV